MSQTFERLRIALEGRYAVERELGAGGMATVYLAEDLKHRRKVAVKVLHPDLAAALGADRFGREIAISAGLQHPNILTLIDSGQADDLLYYVMPFVDGETLRERLTRGGALPVDEAVRYLTHVVDAIAAAHRQGIVHRDIKPENILLSERHALVTDFGVAKAVQSAREGPKLTTAGLSLGTPTYMAPEQAAGDPDVDHRADLYSVGVVAYELLAGRPPFEGPTAQSVMAAHISTPPQPIQERRPDVPAPLAAAVMRCLAKDRAERWQSADELLVALERIATPGAGVPSVPRPAAPLRRAALAAGALALAALGWWGWRTVSQAQAERWLRDDAIPRMRSLRDADSMFAAWQIARTAERRLPGNAALAEEWSLVARTTDIVTIPAGARVEIREFGADSAAWIALGITPLIDVRLPRTYSRMRVELEGHVPLDGGAYFFTLPDTIRLPRAGEVPEGMVRVSGGETSLQLPGLDHLSPVTLADFDMDRLEVTNREYKVFVDSGGYRRPEFWTEPFRENGRTLAFADAVRRFADRSGRPGPSTWEGGTYPSGGEALPVTGVSWYEAAAYARFVGRHLPTIYHWTKAAGLWASAWIVPASNLMGGSAVPVGSFGGISPFGTRDMAGNAREWCANAIGTDRYILGGGWNDQRYAFNDAFAQPPFDRSPTNGIRLVRYADTTDRDLAERPVERVFRDFRRIRPVGDEVFATFRRLYEYDPRPLNATIEVTDSGAADWVRQRIAFDAAYGERMGAILYLPRGVQPPYQTVVYFPGSNVIYARSSDPAWQNPVLDFVIRSGRAVLLPIYKSTYERGDSLRSDYADSTIFYRDHVIMWVQDFRRSVDYLLTRADIDSARIAYYGLSWGGYLGGLIPALEPRVKAVVLYVAGLEFQAARQEAEPINFLPRIRQPVLMMNGKQDHFFPVETSQRPMFELLGAPADRKRWVVYDGGHFVPRPQLISESLSWLDRYLGPVR